jgi:hypothetical protein
LKKKRGILVIVIGVLIAVSLVYFWFCNFAVFSTEEVGMYVTVVEGRMIGVNTDTDALYFGKVRKGGLSTRTIILGNYDENPLLVQIRTFGDLSKWVYVSDNNFVLYPSESKNVSVSCDVPTDAEVGNYTGKMQVVYLNVWGWA